MVFIRDDIPCQQLDKHAFPDDIEGIFIELNFRKSKLLLFGTYHPPSQSNSYYFDTIGKALDIYNTKYGKLLLVGDFNAEETEVHLSKFLCAYGIESLVHEKTCFKSVNNPTCIDLLLTNNKKGFQNTTVLSAGMSDFHKMVVTVMKTTFPKARPKLIFYRNYKMFNAYIFREQLMISLENNPLAYMNFGEFQNTFLNILEKHAPLKKKFLRANEVPYMTKTLRKAIMDRSRFENRYFFTKSVLDKENLNKQRNYCNRLYKRERNKYYGGLKVTSITDNKKFWNTMKPFLTDKGVAKKQITLIEDSKVITDDADVAETFNKYFETAVSSLDRKVPIEHIL